MFLYALEFKSDEKASDYEHYPSILVSFVGKTEHFRVENGAFQWGNKNIKKRGGAISTPMPDCKNIFFSEALEAQAFTKQLEQGYGRVECTRET